MRRAKFDLIERIWPLPYRALHILVAQCPPGALCKSSELAECAGKESGAPRLPLGTFIVSACFNYLFRVASHFFSASSFPLLACKSRPWRH